MLSDSVMICQWAKSSRNRQSSSVGHAIEQLLSGSNLSEAAIGVAIPSCPGVQPRRSYSRLHAIIADSASFANSADRFANNFASDRSVFQDVPVPGRLNAALLEWKGVQEKFKGRRILAPGGI